MIFFTLSRIFFLLATASLFAPVALAALGTSSGGGGGGSGVSCPSPEGRTLEVTDYWEYKERASFIAPQAGDTPGSYLTRILSNRMAGSSVLFTHIQDALSRVKLSEASHKSNLPQINDLGGLTKKLGSCHLEQIAIRYAADGPQGKAHAHVDLDSSLFAQLGKGESPDVAIINKATLQLHEALYLLGYEVGQADSKNVRLLTVLLMAQSTYDTTEAINRLDPQNKKIASLSFLVAASMFGFEKLPFLYESASKNPKKMERLLAYESWQRKMGDSLMAQALDASVSAPSTLTTKNRVDFGVQAEIKTYTEVSAQVSDAEAFMWLAMHAEEAGWIDDFLRLADPAQDDTHEMKVVCNTAKKDPSTLIPGANHDARLAEKEKAFQVIFEKALQYCQGASGI